jgi:hypothetical protein
MNSLGRIHPESRMPAAHRAHTFANITAILFGLCSLVAGGVILLK